MNDSGRGINPGHRPVICPSEGATSVTRTPVTDLADWRRQRIDRQAGPWWPADRRCFTWTWAAAS
jgi:hypothetical protein